MYYDSMILNVLAALLTLISNFIVGFFMMNFLKMRSNNKVRNYLIYFLIVFIFYFLYKSNELFFSIRMLFVLISYILSMIILSNDKWYKKLLFIVLFFVFQYIVSSIDKIFVCLKLNISYEELFAIMNGTTEEYYEVFNLVAGDYSALSTAAVNNILFAFLYLCTLLVHNRKEHKGLDIFLIVLFITIFGYSTCKLVSFYVDNSVINTVVAFITSIATITMLIYTYKRLEFYKTYNEKVAEVKFLKEKEQMQLDYYKEMLQKETEIRKINHDIKNNIQIMLSLKNEEEKEKIIRKINNKLEENKIVRYSKIEILNIILNIKAKEARNKKININYSIRKNIDFMEEIDISNLFSNILDNAIENIDDKEKMIQLAIYKKMNYIVVKCTNTYEDNKRKETKDKNHGYGLKIIKDIANKYNGEVKINKNKNEYEINILLAEE